MIERRRAPRNAGAGSTGDPLGPASREAAERLVGIAPRVVEEDGGPPRPRSRAAVVASVVAGLAVTATVALATRCAAHASPPPTTPRHGAPARRPTAAPDMPGPRTVQRYAYVPGSVSGRAGPAPEF